MATQLFWILCEEIDTPKGPALVKLSKGEVSNEPMIDFDKSVRLAMEYSEAEDVTVFILEAHIHKVAGNSEDLEGYKPPKFTDISVSHFSGEDNETEDEEDDGLLSIESPAREDNDPSETPEER